MKWQLITVLFFIFSFGKAQTIQSFELSNAVDGKSISMNQYSNSPAVVIIFFKQDCPYSEYYLTRIKTLSESYSGKIPVLVINSTTETVQEMEKYAKSNQLNTPYLADKEQKVLKILTPHKSPEGFLLKNLNGKFSVVYRGAIDDNAQSAERVNHAYLQSAIDQFLTGKKIELSEVRPVGCSLQ